MCHLTAGKSFEFEKLIERWRVTDRRNDKNGGCLKRGEILKVKDK